MPSKHPDTNPRAQARRSGSAPAVAYSSSAWNRTVRGREEQRNRGRVPRVVCKRFRRVRHGIPGEGGGEWVDLQRREMRQREGGRGGAGIASPLVIGFSLVALSSAGSRRRIEKSSPSSSWAYGLQREQRQSREHHICPTAKEHRDLKSAKVVMGAHNMPWHFAIKILELSECCKFERRALNKDVARGNN
ncbi:hypothetical protein B0H13DRAFT_1883912 [Mycena leptocephala]|nr:hypothetical protein B0H13DRAFT_1883912 [Mycena leptocephala]